MSRNILFRAERADISQDKGSRWVLPWVGAVAAIVGGGVMIVHELWDAREPGIQADVVSSALHTIWIAALFLAFAGLLVVLQLTVSRGNGPAYRRLLRREIFSRRSCCRRHTRDRKGTR
jgi:hypothetical protein